MRVLVVAAHPDDEVLGCGGTMARLAREGYEVFTLILGEGVRSRYDQDVDDTNIEESLKNLKKQALEANRILGVKEVFFSDFPDNRFDSVDLLDIVKVVERFKKEVKPQIIFTHSKADLNIDHRITYKAVVTATRPMPGASVKAVCSFEVLSSTEWNYPQEFSPNLYFDISDTIGLKLEAMEAYSSELREFPHPRSLEGIKVKATQRGMEVGLKYAEAFEVVRDVR